MDYEALKWTHVTCVVISGVGFAIRGVLQLTNAAIVRHRLVRTLPHLVDSVLLLSAVGMLVALGLWPWHSSWLLAKLLALLLYIALGLIAMRFGPTQRIRTCAWMAALLVFGYIVGVALSKSPWGPLA